MRTFLPLALGILAMALGATRPADAAQDGGAVFAVTYFEAAVTDVAKAAALTKQFGMASRNEPGNSGFEAFEEIGRPSRFAIFEGWHDKTASDAHNTAAAAYRDKLHTLLVGPLEVRNFTGFSVAGPREHVGGGAVYVVTHVDVFPAGKDQAAALVAALAEAGRKMPGNFWFDVLQVDGHANHFTLVEGWRDRASFDASVMAASTREFRQKLTPLEGALYDERLYHALR
ncbi:MAG TPA: antibiotic biosynthesis monooxygenase [Stellaceae bacterium]|nr:antibiotic biosynthesis monooxygenase [Stellaceae bacterium]